MKTHLEILTKLQLNYDCMAARQILSLSEEQLAELLENIDIENDYLIHVSSYGYTVNHGNVGTRGISYMFTSEPDTKENQSIRLAHFKLIFNHYL